ncbi:putative lipopolysaccharide biosynthesis protein [Candidatus Vecturithrix granuli]|uniref:Putative lipopolysaccharide biosynthesis protein n=1 Tax=Vecturithrix granuli TaxID=1499967 RepID=A0A081BZZ4_VECG1|nr:putative lipopolysaccharide biosynthesis protein [Candidatus Vecturithrix granuli]
MKKLASHPLHNQKFRQDILWNIASLTFMGSCGIVLNFVIARFYNPAALGSFNQVFAIYIVASQFSVVGIHLSALKHIAQYQTDCQTYREVLFAALVLAGFISGSMAFVLWHSRHVIGNLLASPDVSWGLQYASPALFFFSINKVLLFGLLNGLSHMRAYAVYQALRYISLMGTLIVVAIFKLSGNNLPIILLIAELIVFVSFIPVFWKEIRIPSLPVLLCWLKIHAGFGFRACISNMLSELNSRVDVLCLGFFTNDYLVGIYSLAAVLVEGFYHLPIVLRNIYNPQLVHLSQQPEHELAQFITLNRRWIYAAMAFIGVTAIALYPIGMRLVISQQDLKQSWTIFAVLMLGLIGSSGYIPFSQIFLQAGRPGLHSIMISLLVLANLIGNILFIPLWGAIGAAYATSLSFLLLIALLKLFSKAALHITI